MQKLDVQRKTHGRIWYRKLSNTEDGCVLSITHTANQHTLNGGPSVRFLRCAFNAVGDKFIAADHQGHLYLFDLHLNRFSLIQKTSFPCTALAFQLHHGDEVLVALSDNSIRCYNIVSKDLVSVMRGHQSAVNQISIHSSGRFALTTSNDTAILWNIDTFTRKRTLNGAQHVGIQKVLFLPLTNTMMSCFKDGSLFVWDCDTMKCSYQLNTPADNSLPYKSLSVSQDSKMLVASSRSRFLHLWNLHTKQLTQVIQLPEKVKEVKSVAFVGASRDSEVLAVLSHDGFVRFVNISNLKVEHEVGGLLQRVSNMIFSSQGKYYLLIHDNGDIAVHTVSRNWQRSSSKVYAPLVTVVDDTNKKEKKDESWNKVRHSKKPSSAADVHWKNDLHRTNDLHKPLPNNLDMTRLLRILRAHGEYPEKYRFLIWRSMLRLPDNHMAFSSLIDKGTHIAYEQLQQNYPIKSRRLLRVLQRVLSALAHWSPLFAELDYLPMMVFPFVKMFENNQLSCFEIVATLICNWCQQWFEFFPNPPLTVLGIIETLLGHHDKPLLNHLVRCNITAQVYAWPLMQTLFSEVFSKSDWLKLWDNLFSQHPSFLLMVICSYLINSRRSLMATNKPSDFKFFFHHQNPVNVDVIIKEAYRLFESTPEDMNPKNTLINLVPLTNEQYPIFDKYPKVVANYLAEEREKIRREELDYLREKQVVLDFQKQSEKTRLQEEAFFRQQDDMIKAEEERRNMIAKEEVNLANQRKRLQAMKREVALKELNLLDEVHGKFLNHQEHLNQIELNRLDDDLRRKITLRDQETKDAIEDAEIKSLEIQAKRVAYQQELLRKEMENRLSCEVDRVVKNKEDEAKENELQSTILDLSATARNIEKQQFDLGLLNLDLADKSFRDEFDKKNELLQIDRRVRKLKVKRAMDLSSQEEHHMKAALDEAVSEKQKLNNKLNEQGVIKQRTSMDAKELHLLKQVRDLRKKLSSRKR